MPAVVLALVGMLLAGSLVHAEPPGRPHRTEQVVASLNPHPQVEISWVTLHVPLPPDAGAHPPECDYLHYLRYRDRNGPADSTDADAIVSTQPGLVGASMYYDAKARQVVEKAAAAGKHVEFWTMDRRSDCLIDRTGLDAGAAARDYHVALDYYFHGKAIDGRTFAGTKDWWDIPGSPRGSASFLRNMRQEQEIRDWHAVMAEAIPDPAVRGKKVFCGGHSYGGLLAGLYSAWDFDRDPAAGVHDGAGSSQCAGFFADDSIANPDPVGLQDKPVLGSLVEMFAGLAYTVNRGIPQVTDGLSALYPYADGVLVFTPETYYMIEILGIAAYFEPDRETDLLRLLPRTPNIELAIRTFLTRTYQQFLTNTPDVWSFRYTNEALLGAILDNNSSPLSILQMGLGSYGDCPVADKDFPLPNAVTGLRIPGFDQLKAAVPQLADVPDIGPLYSNLVGPGDRHVAPIDPAILCTWRSFDEDPQPAVDGTFYTSKDREVTDIREFARAAFEGPGNFLEMYIPYVSLPGNTFMANNRWWEYANAPDRRAIYRKPVLTSWGSVGLLANLEAIDPLVNLFGPPVPLVPTDTVWLPGYRHIDVTTAAPDQNNGQPEIGSRAMVDWIIRNLDS